MYTASRMFCGWNDGVIELMVWLRREQKRGGMKERKGALVRTGVGNRTGVSIYQSIERVSVCHATMLYSILYTGRKRGRRTTGSQHSTSQQDKATHRMYTYLSQLESGRVGVAVHTLRSGVAYMQCKVRSICMCMCV